jgi:hypothetical protein
MPHKPASAEARQYHLDKAYQALANLEGVITEAEQRELRMGAAPAIDETRFPAAKGR